MKIKVKAFASVREAFGFDEKELTVSDGVTVKDVIRQMTMSCQQVRDREMTLLFSINEEYCRDDAPLTDGDRLAIFPPVNGG